MKAKLIEYDYLYKGWDSCRGTIEKEVSNRAILFLNNKNRPIAIAIPKNGRLKIKKILFHNDHPYIHYRVVKSLTLQPKQLDLVKHAIVCYMKMDDLRNSLLKLIQTESKDFDYRI